MQRPYDINSSEARGTTRSSVWPPLEVSEMAQVDRTGSGVPGRQQTRTLGSRPSPRLKGLRPGSRVERKIPGAGVRGRHEARKQLRGAGMTARTRSSTQGLMWTHGTPGIAANPK